MKYLIFFESNYEDLKRGADSWKQIMDETEKGSDKWPKKDQILFLSQILKDSSLTTHFQLFPSYLIQFLLLNKIPLHR